MTWEQAKNHIKPMRIVPPGPRAIQILSKNRNKRMMALGDLPWITGQCAWCDGEITKDKRRKYCNVGCTESAYYYGCPQAHGNKMHRLIYVQNCMCLYCGQDFTDQIIEIIRSKLKNMVDVEDPYTEDMEVTLYSIGYNTGHIWHTDHITAVHKGGDGVGIDNHQTICAPCHHRKTADERKSHKI